MISLKKLQFSWGWGVGAVGHVGIHTCDVSYIDFPLPVSRIVANCSVRMKLSVCVREAGCYSREGISKRLFPCVLSS